MGIAAQLFGSSRKSLVPGEAIVPVDVSPVVFIHLAMVGKAIFSASHLLLANLALPPTCGVHAWTNTAGTITAVSAAILFVLFLFRPASRSRTLGFLVLAVPVAPPAPTGISAGWSNPSICRRSSRLGPSRESPRRVARALAGAAGPLALELWRPWHLSSDDNLKLNAVVLEVTTESDRRQKSPACTFAFFFRDPGRLKRRNGRGNERKRMSATARRLTDCDETSC